MATGDSKMDRQVEHKSDLTVYERLYDVRMSDADRETAVSALRNAELLVDLFAWLAKKVEQVGERSFLKPVLKH
jgi:hypothetical protein